MVIGNRPCPATVVARHQSIGPAKVTAAKRKRRGDTPPFPSFRRSGDLPGENGRKQKALALDVDSAAGGGSRTTSADATLRKVEATLMAVLIHILANQLHAR